jgi:hypothetical protein
MRGLAALALVAVAVTSGGCRQILGLDDLPVDAVLRTHDDARGDVAIDVIVPLPNDRDGDMVKDADDNCPDKPNTSQANEDGDKFGDACDPCPIDMNDTPSDPDGDGVADICDPHPNTAGDTLVLFEGFAAGVPTTWQTIGTATNGTGDVTLTTVAGNHTAIVPPLAMLGNGTLTASIIVDAVVGNMGTSASITLPYNATNDDGIFCELDQDPSGTRYMSIYDTHTQQEKGSNGYNWATGVEQLFRFGRSGNSYACAITPSGGGTHQVNGSTSSGGALGAAQTAIAMYAANAHAKWVMLVTSP